MKNELTNVKILGAYHTSTQKPFDIRSKPHRSLVIRLNKHTVYRTGDEKISSVRGDAVFIPLGSTYTAQAFGENNELLAVRFSSDEAGEWEVMHVDDIGEARAIHSELCRALVFNDRKSKMRQLSLFYRLLSILSEGQAEERYISRQKLEKIRPALEYIEKNIYSQDLKVGELHRLVGLSDVYFREIFTAHTGMKPQAYVTAKRLDRANELIEDGVMTKVKDVAEEVGYADPLYFSRIYKKRFGHAPSAVATKNNGDM